MNCRLLTKIGCRFIALYFFITYIGFLPSAIITFFDVQRTNGVDQSLSLMSSLSPMIFMMLISIFLWVYADKVAKLMAKETDTADLLQDIDYDRIQLIAFSFAGVLIAVQALSETTNLITQVTWLKAQQIMNTNDRMYITYIAKIIGEIVQLLLGLWLIIGTKGIMNGIKSLRTVGVHGRNED